MLSRSRCAARIAHGCVPLHRSAVPLSAHTGGPAGHTAVRHRYYSCVQCTNHTTATCARCNHTKQARAQTKLATNHINRMEHAYQHMLQQYTMLLSISTRTHRSASDNAIILLFVIGTLTPPAKYMQSNSPHAPYIKLGAG